MTAASALPLIFAWGNPSRGDDALGPLFLDGLAALAGTHRGWQGYEALTDFQLQIEHALDLQARPRLLFVDASIDCAAPFVLSHIQAARDASFSSHSLSPQALLQVYRDLEGKDPPPAQLLAIRGERFELGEGLSAAATAHLEAALAWAVTWVNEG